MNLEKRKEQLREAQNRYRKKNRKKAKRIQYKSKAYIFARDYATREEVYELRELLADRILFLKNKKSS